jgi:1-acyl-sn-glycerol-3-phosphate acyltransferase
MAFEAPLSYARRNGTITKRIGRTVMRISGWRFEGELPDVPKVLISVAPHTSNWDFVVGVMGLWSLDIKLSFIGKHTLFRGWFGTWLRSLGGIPADRRAKNGLVGDVVAAFNARDHMILALSPEGTRTLDKGFKSGFLHIAYGAKAPVLLAYFDFKNRVIGFGPLFYTTGNIEADLKHVIDFYRPIRGKYLKAWQSE